MSKRVICSFILKLVVIVSAVVGIYLSAYGSYSEFMAGSSVFMFFTIQSNILIAIICLIGAVLLLRKKEVPNGWYIFKYVGTVAITLTGVVFCVVLAPTLGERAWYLRNVLTHVVVPIGAILDFFVSGIDSDISKKSVFLVTIPPILYAIYAGIGYAQNWQFAPGYNYPYFFLNWGSPAGVFGFTKEIPFMGTAWWILAILFFLLFIGWLYLVILDKFKKKAK